MPKVPRALSVGEETFALQCKAYSLSPVRELVFAPGRKYRFDFAWPAWRLAVEIEGGTRNGGRHTTGSGFEADCGKYNLATEMGWRVLRFTTAMVARAEAIDTVRRILEGG